MKICAVHGCCITIYIYSKYHLARDSSMSYISIYIYIEIYDMLESHTYIYILCRKKTMAVFVHPFTEDTPRRASSVLT